MVVDESIVMSDLVRYVHNVLIENSESNDAHIDDELIDAIKQLYLHYIGRITAENAGIVQGIAKWLVDKGPLRHSKIVRQLGYGEHGYAFLLSNDHVFKIFHDAGDDSEWHDTLLARAYAGASSRRLPMVYDNGCIFGSLCYVEMSRVRSLDSYMRLTGRSDHDIENVSDELDHLYDVVTYINPTHHVHLVRSMSARIKMSVDNRMHSLSRVERYKLYRAIFDLIRTSPSRGIDLHMGNIGVDMVSGAWIIFDR